MSLSLFLHNLATIAIVVLFFVASLGLGMGIGYLAGYLYEYLSKKRGWPFWSVMLIMFAIGVIIGTAIITMLGHNLSLTK